MSGTWIGIVNGIGSEYGIEMKGDVVKMERNVLALVAIVFPPRLPSLSISTTPKQVNGARSSLRPEREDLLGSNDDFTITIFDPIPQ
jgi:hypothetical protein